MGVTRKFLSVSTVGLVRFRTANERTARHTRQTRDIMRRQSADDAFARAWANRKAKKYARENAADAERFRRLGAAATNPSNPPEGWYVDPADDNIIRWWDGKAWTEHTSLRDWPRR